MECVARELADGETEVSVLLPERKYKGAWRRVLHDRTGEAIQEQVSHLAHANVTTVPFHFGTSSHTVVSGSAASSRGAAAAAIPAVDPSGDPAADALGALVDGRRPIIDASWRQHVTISGRVRSMRVAPMHDSPTLEVVLVDETAAISVVFLGRREIAGIEVGTAMVVEGTVGIHKARLAILNPSYRLLA